MSDSNLAHRREIHSARIAAPVHHAPSGSTATSRRLNAQSLCAVLDQRKIWFCGRKSAAIARPRGTLRATFLDEEQKSKTDRQAQLDADLSSRCRRTPVTAKASHQAIAQASDLASCCSDGGALCLMSVVSRIRGKKSIRQCPKPWLTIW